MHAMCSGKVATTSKVRPAAASSFSPSITSSCNSHFGSASLWMRWRTPRKREFLVKRSMARPATSGKSSGTQPTTPLIHG